MQFILNNRSVIFNGAVPGDTANTWTQYTGYKGSLSNLFPYRNYGFHNDSRKDISRSETRSAFGRVARGDGFAVPNLRAGGVGNLLQARRGNRLDKVRPFEPIRSFAQGYAKADESVRLGSLLQTHIQPLLRPESIPAREYTEQTALYV